MKRFRCALDALGSTLERAQGAEDAFAAKRGSLQEAIYERARADVALAVATAAALTARRSSGAIRSDHADLMQQVLALLGRWNALPARARLASACALGVLAVVAIAGSIITHPPQTALFPAPLHSEQLLEVQEQLANWNVPFTPLNDNVVVDGGRRNDLLLRLSLAGVPHAHLETTGEALANVGALTPQAVIDAQARAGLAGDIEAGLRGVAGVDDARAIVVPAVAAEFGDQRARDASASVRLRLRPGARLARETISGIRAYVAASVAGLDPAHVTLLDDDGVALGSGAGGEAANLERELQGALDAAFGEGGSIVRVRTEYRNTTVAERTRAARSTRRYRDRPYGCGRKLRR